MKTIASILVVDDELTLLNCLKLVLERAGYRVWTARDGIEALAMLKSQPVDLILADIAMPHMNGYQLYECVVENPQWVTIPFLFLTARAQDSDIRYGKELGVDDYLTKPIRLEDLLAAVRGKLRRVQQLARLSAQRTVGPSWGPDGLALGRLRIDPGQYRVWLDGESIKLSAREFRLLECLARQTNRVVPLQELIQVTHGLEADCVEAGTLLRPLVRSLRRKLGYSAGDMGCVQNVRSIGYHLIPPS